MSWHIRSCFSTAQAQAHTTCQLAVTRRLWQTSPACCHRVLFVPVIKNLGDLVRAVKIRDKSWRRVSRHLLVSLNCTRSDRFMSWIDDAKASHIRPKQSVKALARFVQLRKGVAQEVRI